MSDALHCIELKDAKDLSITGVEFVQSATPTSIVINTICGGLVVKGKQLHVEKVDLELKEFLASGKIEGIKYVPAKKSFLKRLLK